MGRALVFAPQRRRVRGLPTRGCSSETPNRPGGAGTREAASWPGNGEPKRPPALFEQSLGYDG